MTWSLDQKFLIWTGDDAIAGLDPGEKATLTFNYTVQVSNGTYSTAQVKLTINGTGTSEPPPLVDPVLDIVAGGVLGNFNIGVALNSGGGTFPGANTYPTGGSPKDLALGDVTGDGKLDVVSVSDFNNLVTVMSNTGSGEFSSQQTITVGHGPSALALGRLDTDTDTDLDMVVANRSANSVSVLLNNGSGTFSTLGSPIDVGLLPNDIALGYLNSGAALDFVTANDAGTLSVGLGDGLGGFTTTVNAGSAGAVAVAIALGDMNSDGKLDAVVANGALETVTVLAGTGTGGFVTDPLSPNAPPRVVGVIGPATDVAVGYLDAVASTQPGADYGTLDFVAVGSYLDVVYFGKINVRLNNGNGTYDQTRDYTIFGAILKSVALGDVNGDGEVDIVVANESASNVWVLLGDGAGNFGTPTPVGVGLASQSVALGDLGATGAAGALPNLGPLVPDPAGLIV
ncbi:FG-GAP repeat domain-containing protein [Falsiroseomonas sp. HW251]|uniref:FG-GAP repeat domain-containing protein n=1 Tax=Falsiroseomonas sp. HW251 TaxID=3390998 RepID=UPI003D31BA60